MLHRSALAIVASTMISACACGAGQPAAPTGELPPAAVPAGVVPALAPVAWLLGDWTGDAGSEHWVTATGTFYGVRFTAAGWEVMVIDDGAQGEPTADGVRRYIQLGAGDRELEHREATLARDHARFAAATGEVVDYALRDGALEVTTGATTLRFRAGTRTPAPALEAADREFAQDTKATGVAGWVTWFAADGAMWRDGRIEGAAAIGAKMQDTLTTGVLAWEPIASGLHGDLGFTVGSATWTATGAAAPAWAGNYVTIWQKQADATWKVAFDTGRIQHAPAP